jgi:hypothetical protein
LYSLSGTNMLVPSFPYLTKTRQHNTRQRQGNETDKDRSRQQKKNGDMTKGEALGPPALEMSQSHSRFITHFPVQCHNSFSCSMSYIVLYSMVTCVLVLNNVVLPYFVVIILYCVVLPYVVLSCVV